jgi:hypothetical protein
MRVSKHQLLHGPYTAPALHRRDRKTCIYRDAEVVITSWTDALISWPRCRAIGHRGGSGLLVDEELVRAIHTESSLALQYWFGVHEAAVWKWRQAFGVPRYGTEGSQRLHEAVSERGAAKLRGKRLPKAVVKRRIEVRADKGFKVPKRWAKTGWQQWQLDLLGTAPDAELAERFGRTVTAVRVMRNRLGRRQP